MSKEQTPKDFESYLEQMGYSWNDFDYTSGIEGFVEQYAQTKVLEALERDKEERAEFFTLVVEEIGLFMANKLMNEAKKQK